MSKYEFEKKDFLPIAVILFIAILLRIAYLYQYSHSNISAYPLLPYSDGYYYYLWGLDIAGGDLLGMKAFMKWPLYAYFLGALFKLLGTNILFIYLLQFITGIANCLLVYLIAKIIFDRRAAYIAGVLCALYGLFMFYEGLLVYISTSLFLNSILLLMVLAVNDKTNRRNLFWLGLFLGICAVTQGSILLFGLLYIPLLLIVKYRNFKKAARDICWFLFGLSIVIGSATLANYMAEKDFVPVTGNTGINFYFGNNPKSSGVFYCPDNITRNQEDMYRDARIIAETETARRLKTSEVSGFWFNKAANFIREDPVRYLKLLFKKIIYTFSPREYIVDAEYWTVKDRMSVLKFVFTDLRFIMPFVLLGMLLGLKRFKDFLPLYALVATLSLSVSIFFVSTRYRIAMVPFFMIFAAFAMSSMLDFLKSKKYIKLGLVCVFLAALCLFYGRAASVFEPSDKSRAVFNYHFGRGMDLQSKSDYQDAIRQFNLARESEPDNRWAVFQLGVIYYQLSDFKLAEEKFKEAIKISPLFMDAYYNLGLMYNSLKRPAEAIEALSKAVYLYPEDAASHFELGLAYKSVGRPKDAADEFRASLKNINRWRITDRAMIEKELASAEKV